MSERRYRRPPLQIPVNEEDSNQESYNNITSEHKRRPRQQIEIQQENEIQQEAPNIEESNLPLVPTNQNTIACPDCGQIISKRAVTCPHCGCPLQQLKTAKLIRIKLPEQPSPTFLVLSWSICEKNTGELLGKARPKAIFEYESEKPIEMEIRANGALMGFSLSVLEPGKKYACSWSIGLLLPRLSCYEIDTFDSE